MASKKKQLEAAVEATQTELATAQNAYADADARLRAARRALDAATLALVQSERLSDVALAFLAQTASPGGYTYYRKSRLGATIRKLERMALVERHGAGALGRVSVVATDAGRAKLAEYAEALAKKGGA